MSTSEPDLSRLLAGEQALEDPSLIDVAAFLAALRATYPPAPVDAVREQHLAAVSREVRLMAAAPRPQPVASHRARRRIVTAVTAALALLTAGAGVATAMGGNPLMILPGLRVGPPEVPRSGVPTAVPSGSPSVTAAERPRSGPPSPLPNPTTAPGKSGEEHGTPTVLPSNNGKASEAQASHKPTALPTQATALPSQATAKADPPAKGRSSVRPTPASTGSEVEATG